MTDRYFAPAVIAGIEKAKAALKEAQGSTQLMGDQKLFGRLFNVEKELRQIQFDIMKLATENAKDTEAKP
jgi:hypothetical protein